MASPKLRLKKRNPDVRFIDPSTMKVRCTFNGCIEKFTISREEDKITTPKWAEGRVVARKRYFHECHECGARVQSGEDVAKSIDSYRQAIAGQAE